MQQHIDKGLLVDLSHLKMLIKTHHKYHLQ